MVIPTSAGGQDSSAEPTPPHRPTEALLNTQSTSDALGGSRQSAASKKRRNRGKRTKGRRQSFLPTTGERGEDENANEGQVSGSARPPFYRLGQSGSLNLSETSLDSNALLDHR